MAMMEAISVRNIAKLRSGPGRSAVIVGPSSCVSVNVDCRSRNFSSAKNNGWTALSLDNGRAIGIEGRIRNKLSARGPSPPHGLESKRSVQQEERKEDSEGKPGISSAGDGDSDGGVVEAEFEAEESGGAAKTDEKATTSPDDIGKALSELRKEKIAAGVQDPASTTDFWQGVAEETKLIEWPALPKVWGTTGVVVAMILGSSVVLLTVNAILAEGSDLLFNNPTFKEFARGTLNLYW